MRKLLAVLASLIYLTLASPAFAQTITIQRPTVGYSDLSLFINNAIQLAFIVAIIIALAMLIWGAVEWILSGGNKDAVGNARGRIIHALVGLAILAVAFAIISLVGTFLGINLFNLPIPSPSNPTPLRPNP